ncbi:MAG: serine protease [Nostocaceae cyanobacterium]|nr:serine protease [Nostocaceae cyanobacterium]
MNNNFSRVNSLNAILAGTATVAAIVITQPAVAKSAKEVAAIAIPTTVKIENPVEPIMGGSGVIIAKKGDIYTVLTANHVVKDEAIDSYTIVTAPNKKSKEGEEYPTLSITRLMNSKLDLALVTFKSKKKYKVAPLNISGESGIGSGIYISGYPVPTPGIQEREYTFSGGEVISERLQGENGYTMIYNAVTLRGMSGGPVFDVNGRVVGIHGQGDALSGKINEATSLEQGADKTGRNLAIPITSFMALNLKEFGIKLPKLKIDNSPADNDKAETPSKDELKSWYNNVALGIGLGIVERAIPIKIPRIGF